MMCRPPDVQYVRRAVVVIAVATALTASPIAAQIAKLPDIRISVQNPVPRCVSPDRLMAFLKTRNPQPDPRYRDIARWYKHWGEAWRVRWDYAFFQMAIETNFLTYRQPNGKMGDVDPDQHNFAGIGTTGGGVPGDSFPDVKTGVLAQIQHLVVYSGERLANPVAPRTQLKQDDIVEASVALNRTVRFSDLARRWAVDPKYGSSIAWVAEQFRQQQCSNPNVPAPEEVTQKRERAAAVKERPVQAAAVAPPRPGSVNQNRPAAAAAVLQPVNGGACLIQTATYGGSATILIRQDTAARTEYTALTVLDGFEDSMTDSYIRARAPGGRSIGGFPDQVSALTRARELCPPAATGSARGQEANAR